MESAAERLNRTRLEINEAEQRAGRQPGSVKLVAVSKTQDAESILPVLAQHQRIFGENRVQEAKAKWPGLKTLHDDIELHLIGPLQSNKCADAVALFDVIETVDREKIARELAKEMARQHKFPKLFIQVNTGAEPQKAGISVDEAVGFVNLCREKYGLAINGLMCIPPFDEDPAPHFECLSNLARQCGVEDVSMGMSGDFAIAIAKGATHVRVGTAIFGERLSQG